MPLLALITAFCSMIYELCFAHILSSFIGSTVLSYSLVIGIYVFALGLGALFIEHKEGLLWRGFLRLELAIVLSVFLGLFFILLLVNLYDVLSWPMSGFFSIPFFMPVLLIGFLTGGELPYLFKIFTSKEGEQQEALVLFYDYIATFAATLIFPLILLPQAGVLSSLFMVTFLNLFVAGYMLHRMGETAEPAYKNMILALAFAIVIANFYADSITHSMVVWVF